MSAGYTGYVMTKVQADYGKRCHIDMCN